VARVRVARSGGEYVTTVQSGVAALAACGRQQRLCGQPSPHIPRTCRVATAATRKRGCCDSPQFRHLFITLHAGRLGRALTFAPDDDQRDLSLTPYIVYR